MPAPSVAFEMGSIRMKAAGDAVLRVRIEKERADGFEFDVRDVVHLQVIHRLLHQRMVVGFNGSPRSLGGVICLKHTSRTVRAKALRFASTQRQFVGEEPVDHLQMNDIAYVEFETVSPLFFDPYTQNRITGSFILIDPISNATLGAGMIRADLSDQTVVEGAIQKPVTTTERYKRHGHYPALIWWKVIPPRHTPRARPVRRSL